MASVDIIQYLNPESNRNICSTNSDCQFVVLKEPSHSTGYIFNSQRVSTSASPFDDDSVNLVKTVSSKNDIIVNSSDDASLDGEISGSGYVKINVEHKGSPNSRLSQFELSDDYHHQSSLGSNLCYESKTENSYETIALQNKKYCSASHDNNINNMHINTAANSGLCETLEDNCYRFNNTMLLDSTVPIDETDHTYHMSQRDNMNSDKFYDYIPNEEVCPATINIPMLVQNSEDSGFSGISEEQYAPHSSSVIMEQRENTSTDLHCLDSSFYFPHGSSTSGYITSDEKVYSDQEILELSSTCSQHYLSGSQSAFSLNFDLDDDTLNLCHDPKYNERDLCKLETDVPVRNNAQHCHNIIIQQEGSEQNGYITNTSI